MKMRGNFLKDSYVLSCFMKKSTVFWFVAVQIRSSDLYYWYIFIKH